MNRWQVLSSKANLAIVGIVACLVLFVLILVKTAWVCDDAFITFRTVDNFVNGYGLTWNTGERVQAYTNPLWMFVITAFYAFTRDAYHSCVYLSMAASILAVTLLAFGIAKQRIPAAIGILVLTLSKAFTDYATSGLETAQTFLILAIFLAVHFRPAENTSVRLFWLTFTAALGAVNRLDTLLIYLPALGAALWASWREAGSGWGRIRVLRRAFLGSLPLLAWEVFSLVYYGFLFPNTAYAKLNTGIPIAELVGQGAYYFLNSLEWDPVTLTVTAFAVILAVLRRDGKSLAIAAGIVLYLIYVLRIGGDFMSGRFFAAPLFCAVALLVRMQLRGRFWAGFIVVTLVLGLTPAARSPITSDWNYIGRADESHGITDERANYYPYTGLLIPLKIFTHPVPHEALRARFEGPSVRVFHCIGFYGYFAGPDVHVVDGFALTDPLLARLPMKYEPDWRVGHYFRPLPDGYLKTLETGEDRLVDRNLAAYNEKLRLITRGPLFDVERWHAIVRMNLGLYDDLIDVEAYR